MHLAEWSFGPAAGPLPCRGRTHTRGMRSPYPHASRADPPEAHDPRGAPTSVAVKIKLMRLGKIRQPYYRIVVADARTRRSGRAIETIGKYHPKNEPSFIEVDSERAQYWLGVGAPPTDPVRPLL